MNLQQRAIPQISALFIALAALMPLLGACGAPTPPTPTPTAPPPIVALVVNPPDIKDLLPGQTVPINADTSGQDISFKWTVTRGVISSADAPAVIYTAPDSPGIDIVTVEVNSAGGTTTKSVSFNVVTPQPTTPVPTPETATATPPPAATPTAAAVLTPAAAEQLAAAPAAAPLECRHPAITEYLFPQLAAIAGQRAFYGPIEESPEVFKCEGVRDNVHSGPVSIKIEYNVAPGADKFGFFGFGTLGGFDAAPYKQLCLWAYAEEPDQAFRLKMKDTAGTENGIDITVQQSDAWDQICADLQQFAQLGIDVSKLENINLGFEPANGSATVWVDDFQLVK